MSASETCTGRSQSTSNYLGQGSKYWIWKLPTPVGEKIKLTLSFKHASFAVAYSRGKIEGQNDSKNV